MKTINIDQNFLTEEYLNKNKSIKEIALLLGCNPKTVSSYIKKYNIKKIFKTKENLIGQKFTRLTVIELDCIKNNDIYWKCECDCGTIKSIRAQSLIYLATKSCGCWNLEVIHAKVGKNHPNYRGYKEITGHYWSGVRSNAKERNLEFNITQEYVWQIFEMQNKQCALSKLSIYFSGYDSKNQTASIDRINSNKGYIEDNIQIIHKDINWMKNNFDQEKFIYYCNLISQNNPRNI